MTSPDPYRRKADPEDTSLPKGSRETGVWQDEAHFRCPCDHRTVKVTALPHGVAFNAVSTLTIERSCGSWEQDASVLKVVQGPDTCDEVQGRKDWYAQLPTKQVPLLDQDRPEIGGAQCPGWDLVADNLKTAGHKADQILTYSAKVMSHGESMP